MKKDRLPLGLLEIRDNKWRTTVVGAVLMMHAFARASIWLPLDLRLAKLQGEMKCGRRTRDVRRFCI